MHNINYKIKSNVKPSFFPILYLSIYPLSQILQMKDERQGLCVYQNIPNKSKFHK